MNKDESKKFGVENQTADYLASLAKGVFGAVPVAGSLMAELVGNIIPNQKVDRIGRLAVALEARLGKLDQEFVRSKLTDENFTDLMEEGMRQAARSVSEERRKYLASLLVNGLKVEDVSFVESKHLLRILGELNDMEVLWLRYYLFPGIHSDKEFREKNKDVLGHLRLTMGSTQAERDKYAIHKSYKEHLAKLGLLEPRFETDMETKVPKFDAFSGGMKVSGYSISLLGKLLLRQISFSEDEGK